MHCLLWFQAILLFSSVSVEFFSVAAVKVTVRIPQGFPNYVVSCGSQAATSVVQSIGDDCLAPTGVLTTINARSSSLGGGKTVSFRNFVYSGGCSSSAFIGCSPSQVCGNTAQDSPWSATLPAGRRWVAYVVGRGNGYDNGDCVRLFLYDDTGASYSVGTISSYYNHTRIDIPNGMDLVGFWGQATYCGPPLYSNQFPSTVGSLDGVVRMDDQCENGGGCDPFGTFCQNAFPTRVCRPCTNACQHGGLCVPPTVPGGPTTCNCTNAAPYFGPSCSNFSCTPACANGGACVDHNTCQCVNGWEGPTCEVFNCTNPQAGPCNNGGTCPQEGGLCQCINGYFGNNCSRYECVGNGTCQHGGTCVAPNMCECSQTGGYFGDQCQSFECTGASVCQNNGTCVAPNTCDCSTSIPLPGYSGPTCTNFTCSQPCQNGGSCIGPDICQCVGGWFGDICTDFNCTQTCEHGGQCVAPDTCDCSGTGGYYGSDCSSFDCQGRLCQNGGVCVAPNFCNCTNGFYGATAGCTLFSCTGNCSGHGLCIGPEACLCNIYYDSPNCSLFKCTPPCHNGGTCAGEYNWCECVGGWFGPTCDNFTCGDDGCQHGGTCVGPNNCNCENAGGYIGPLCANFTCPAGCANNGTCTGPSACSCEGGYFGPTCEQFTCTQPCRNGGTCVAPEECHCSDTEGWFGPTCTNFTCVQDCENGGLCIAPDRCNCTGDYYGNRCELTVNNIDNTNNGDSSNNLPLALGVGVGVGGFLLLLLLLLALLGIRSYNRKRRNYLRSSMSPGPSSMMEWSLKSIFIIPYSKLKIQDKIGEGAFGEVFRGEYNKVPVAIKQLHNTRLTEKDMEEFQAEADIMSSMPPHPNVVMFRGVTLPPDPITLVTDFCNEGSLLSVLKKSNFSLEKKLNLIADIAKGMIHLHFGIPGREVIHRDLACRNVLMNNGKACVSDFGMARLKQSEEDSSKTETKVGPLKWMAPESIQEQVYSRKSDVFSFGVVIWEVLNDGKNPWPGVQLLEAANRVCRGQRMDLGDLQCPEAVKDIMRRCWEHDPAKRPEFLELVDMIGTQIDIDRSDISVPIPMVSPYTDTGALYSQTPADTTKPNSTEQGYSSISNTYSQTPADKKDDSSDEQHKQHYQNAQLPSSDVGAHYALTGEATEKKSTDIYLEVVNE